MLAYIYLERQGRPDLFVNARVVSAGYARTLSIPPNTAHAAELAALERTAALAGRGLWSACGSELRRLVEDNGVASGQG